jgi:hypothetical protein
MKTFFFKYGEWGIKIRLFILTSKNVNLISVKSAPKKGFSQKSGLPIEKLAVPEKLFFLGKPILGAIFTKVKCTFLKSV